MASGARMERETFQILRKLPFQAGRSEIEGEKQKYMGTKNK